MKNKKQKKKILSTSSKVAADHCLRRPIKR